MMIVISEEELQRLKHIKNWLDGQAKEYEQMIWLYEHDLKEIRKRNKSYHVLKLSKKMKKYGKKKTR